MSALKTLLARKELDKLRADMDALTAKNADYDARAAELETALDEAATDDDISAVRELIQAFDAERSEHSRKIQDLQAQIDAKSAELRDAETNAPPVNQPPATAVRKEAHFPMSFRALAHMSPERRDRFLASQEVNDFVERFRAKFRGSANQTRSVSGADLLIPDTVLEVLRENVSEYSKLYKFVRVASVSGTARQTIMGNIPEAVWTEMCASLNELFFTMGQVETDGYMVGGYVPICNATLDDSNPVLLNEIITGLGRAIGKALDKAIIFGTGVKMPIGFVTRLAQSAKPADYPASGRKWEDLRTSNIITIPANVTGLALFQALIIASGSAKGSYSDGRRFWAMTDATYTKLVSEAMSINAAGAIATGMSRVMPIIGGDIVNMGDGGDILPDNV